MHASAPEPPLQATRGHTLALLVLLIVVPLAGLLLPQAATTSGGGLGGYLSFLAAQWMLVAWVRLGTPLKPLIGEPWRPADIGLALLGFVGVLLIEACWPTRATALKPTTAIEACVWIAVAFTAAFAEELVYRGYLRRQLARLTGSAAIGQLSQAVLFGLAHADRGGTFAIKAGLYGLALGLVVQLRRSLWPAMLCHLGIDLASAWPS